MGKILEAISTAPAEAWVGLIGVIAGSLLAIFTAWLTSIANRRQLKIQLEHEERVHQRRVAKERLEELYSLVSQWEAELVRSNVLLYRLIAEKITIDQYTETMKDAQSRIDFNRIVMITGVYGHPFQAAFDEVLVARDEGTSIIELWMQSIMQSKPNQELANQLISKLPRLNGAIAHYKKEIVKAAKEV